jgi:hypothetical protein
LQLNGRADQLGVGIKIVAPEPIAEQRDEWCVWPIILRLESTPEDGMHAEHPEQAGACAARLHTPWLSAAGQVRFLATYDVAVTADVFEDIDLSRPFVVLGGRDSKFREVRLISVPYGDQASRIVERQRPEQNRIDDCEDGGVRADAERERQNNGQREDRRAAKHTVWMPVSRFSFLVGSA